MEAENSRDAATAAPAPGLARGRERMRVLTEVKESARGACLCEMVQLREVEGGLFSSCPERSEYFERHVSSFTCKSGSDLLSSRSLGWRCSLRWDPCPVLVSCPATAAARSGLLVERVSVLRIYQSCEQRVDLSQMPNAITKRRMNNSKDA